MPLRFLPLLGLLLTFAACAPEDAAPDPSLYDEATLDRARALAQSAIIVDGHIDVPFRMVDYPEDISDATPLGDFDHPRAQAGGLNVPFMSVYIPARYQETGGAFAFADSLIDMVEGFADDAPAQFAVATRVAEVRDQFASGHVSLAMGMENGAPIEGDLANLRHFFDRGIRYITLTHGKDNHLSDSSYDTTGTWGGLSPFGREVVAEMNRLGMMIDISHLSDNAANQVLDLTTAPVIASHSSMRRFTPDWERNMSDDVLRRLADNGGVVMINFGSSFIKTAYQPEGGRVRTEGDSLLALEGLDPDAHEGRAFLERHRKNNPVGTIQDVADHIDHAVNVVGVEHVGLGSDYDGVYALPANLADVSTYPNLIAELLTRGYSEDDIRLILGENVLRVWSAVEDHATAND